MNGPFPIKSLEVVAYATSLSKAMVPTIVTPVFRVREKPDIVVFPPFVIHDNQVCNGTVGSGDELDQFVGKGEATHLPHPYRAQAEYELWVDGAMVAQYNPRADVDEQLGEIAKDHLKKAVLALKAGELEDADSLAGVALCADDRLVDPVAVRAAVRRRQGDDAAVEIMARMAEEHCSSVSFEAIVKRYSRLISCTPDADSRRPLHDVATRKPREMLAA